MSSNAIAETAGAGHEAIVREQPARAAATSLAQRLMSLDAFRGFIMIMMISDGLGVDRVASHFTGDTFVSHFWHFLASQLDHRRWQGCAAWDLIQPSFMFMVGVALPFSLASRLAKGHSRNRTFLHALWRSAVMVLLAVLFITNARQEPRTDWSFTNVLAQIGFGYWFLHLVAGRGWKLQAGAIAAILLAYWYAFVQHPLPPEGFNYASVGVKSNFPMFSGFASHWNHGPNFAEDFDRWFLNLFPPPAGEPFSYNTFGYATLNFIPSLCTMIMGVMAGEVLRGVRSAAGKLRTLLMAGVSLVALGVLLDPNLLPGVNGAFTVCPAVKVIYTPTFVLYSTGWCFLLLSAFYWIIDMRGLRSWAIPLVVVGLNSIGVYLMFEFCGEWIRRTVDVHTAGLLFAGTYGPIIERLSVLAVLWLVSWWMYRRKIFLKI